MRHRLYKDQPAVENGPHVLESTAIAFRRLATASHVAERDDHGTANANLYVDSCLCQVALEFNQEQSDANRDKRAE